MCKKRHKQKRKGSDKGPVTLETNETPAKSMGTPVDVNISKEHLKEDDRESISSREQENRRPSRGLVRSPKIRKRCQSKSPFRFPKRCPLSLCTERDEKSDDESEASIERGVGTNIHKKKERKCLKVPRGWKRYKRRVTSQGSPDDKNDIEPNPSFNGSMSSDNNASSSDRNKKKSIESSPPKIETKREQDLSPRLLRAFSSDSMLWSEASWNTPNHQLTANISNRSSKRIETEIENIETQNEDLTQHITTASPVTDELRVIYTTPERLDHLQGQVDQTRDILRPIIVNRVRGMIDWAMDDLHRSLKLSAATNQEFLTIGDSHDNRPRRLWMTELFSRKSTRRARSALPRLPSSQLLTPAVAAARESAFSLIAPSRNISVRLMTDQVKSDTDLIIPHATGNKDGNNSDGTKVSQSEIMTTTREVDKQSKMADTDGSQNKVKPWWRFNQKGKSQPVQDVDNRKKKYRESKDQQGSKIKDGEKRKRLSFKTLRDVLRARNPRSKSRPSSKTQVKTDPQPSGPDKIIDTKPNKEADNKKEASKQPKESARTKDGEDAREKTGKVSRTLVTIRKGWKRLNDWLDE